MMLSFISEYFDKGQSNGVLWPLLFVIFINDLDACNNYAEIFLFADDAKLLKHVRTDADITMLQIGCDSLFQWSSKRLLKLNIDKCKVITTGLRSTTGFSYSLGSQVIDTHLTGHLLLTNPLWPH